MRGVCGECVRGCAGCHTFLSMRDTFLLMLCMLRQPCVVLRGWHTYCYVCTPEPYSNGYFASLVAMARHWYKLADHSVTYMVERGRSAPPVSTVAHGFAPSLPSYICDI